MKSVVRMDEKSIDVKEILKEIGKELDNLLLIDQVQIKSRMKRIRQRMKDRKPAGQMAEKLSAIFKSSLERVAKRDTSKLDVKFPENLPITSCVDEIKDALQENQLIIVCGTTGSGKTTQLPKILIDAGYGKAGRIGCTQPRRLAASSMARRVAKELNSSYGREVGCQVRFDDMTSDETIVKFMTDGILLAETRHDKQLLQYDTLIIDEAHERSLNIDFILGYLKTLLPRRPDLKVIISSATLDAEGFSKFYGDVPVIQVEGRTFPVEDVFLPPKEDEDLYVHIARAVKWISDVDREGDILVFLPGEREIREATEYLEGKRFPRTEVLPLYGRLSMAEQQRVFQPGGRRRIVLATNVAETSITIPGIHYVIDSGKVRISRYNPRTQVQALLVEQVSKASARQRRGRCGRISEGVCLYLYSEEVFEDSVEYTDPEIRRTSLAGVILQMAILGLPSIEEFPLIDPPQDALVREGYRSLIDICALDKQRNLTTVGRELAGFPVDPHMARMLWMANEENVLAEVIIIVAFLSIQDPRERPAERQQSADAAHKQHMDEKSDFMTILNVWNFIQEERVDGSNSKVRKLCKKNFLNYMRVREWFNLTGDLIRSVRDLRWSVPKQLGLVDEPNYDLIHRSILSGLPGMIGLLDEEKMYVGVKNRKFNIFPASGLYKHKKTPKWIMAFSLMHTSKLFARIVAEIDPTWLEDVAPHMCKKTYKSIHWSMKRGFVSATEMVMSGGLLINPGRSVHYGAINVEESRTLFIRDAMATGDIQTRGKWLELHRKMLKNIERLEIKIRRPDYLLDVEEIYKHYENVLPDDICSTKTLENWLRESKARIAMRMEDAIVPQMEPINFKDYPDKLFFYDEAFKLRYSFEPGEIEDGAVMFCPSEKLGMLPDWACDWVIPAWLPERVKLLIKSLPKQQRIACNPIQDTVDEFIDAVNNGDVDRNQYLLEALGYFLQQRVGMAFEMEDFDIERLPKYQMMKVAETDESGRILQITEGLPDREQLSSKLSSAVKTVKQWIVAGKKCWPGDEIPKSIPLDKDGEMEGYPALVDEGSSVGQQVFMDEREAAVSHREGLVRLFRIECRENVKMIEKKLPLTSYTQMSLSLIDEKVNYTRDFMDSVIWDSLTEDGRYFIRSSQEFDKRAEEARTELFGVAQMKAKQLGNMVEVYGRVLAEAEESHVYVESEEDINGQLAFLFRPGFMKCNQVWKRYPAYVKALKVRMERIANAPDKDPVKLEIVQPFQEMLDERIAEVEDFDHAYGLLEFAWLLEEFRIAQFAPEVGTVVKASAKRLNKLWSELNL